MANIYTLKSGNASDTTVWSGGVVPVSGDRVLICTDHTVTLDGAYEWGDDSTSTISINSISTTASIFIEGTLKASRAVNSQLTCKGHFFINAKTGSYGTYDAGTAADPIPNGVTHTLILNKSAALGNAKYGLQTYSGGTALQGRFSAQGAYRKRNPVLIGAVSVGATSALVDDATGWQVGDQIVFAPTTSATAVDLVTILTLTPGTGTTATITFSPLAYAHLDGIPVGNLSSNVTFKPYAAANPGWTYMLLQTGFTSTSGNSGFIHLCNARIEGTGGSGSVFQQFGMLSVIHNNVNASEAVFDDFNGLAFYATGAGISSSAALSMLYSRQTNRFANCAAYISQSPGGAFAFEYSNAVADFSDTVIYRSVVPLTSSFSQGGCYCVHRQGVKIFGTTFVVNLNVGFSPTFTDVVFGPSSNSTFFQLVNASAALFERCDFGKTFGVGVASYAISNSGSYYTSDALLRDCQFHPSINTRPASMHISLPSYKVVIENKNADVSLQELHTPPGSYYRDNDVSYRGASSVKLVPAQFGSFTPYAQSQVISVSAPNNSPVTVVGYLRKNAAYGSDTRPSVTLSGLGIAPQTFTLSDSVDTWEPFSFTATQSSGHDGNLSLTFSAQSANAGAAAYFDGVPFGLFITSVRHYGYKFQETAVTREVDPVIQLSESAAAALTGLAIDWNTSTVTLTGTRTIRELYDWCHYQLVQTANLTRQEFITSADGVNFNCLFNLVIDGGKLTGSGAIGMASKTLTLTNGGTSDVVITHSAGVANKIVVTGYTVGARLQVFDVTAASELYNGIPASGVLSLQANWTSDHTIRVRMARTVGTTADALIQAFGALSSTGAAFLLSPQPDAVYIANGIDGDTVTEFTADFPNVQIDVNDLDGSTTPQRGYAWYMAGQMTAAGIANFHGGMSADDEVNYRINVGTLDMRVQNVSTLPCIISGARLYRSDGSSIFAVGTGPIQADPDKAYLANTDRLPGVAEIIAALNATTIPVDVQKTNGVEIIGDGTEGNKFRSVHVG